MFVVGLGHRARQGKDYLAKSLVMHCNARGLFAKQFAFADALRSYCRVAFGMREKDAPLLQVVGTDIFRKRNPDIWVRVLEDTLNEQQPEVAIITDMRFPNEAEMIKRLGGATIDVQRLTSAGFPYVADDRDPNHPSETALDGYAFDREIVATSGDTIDLVGQGIDTFESLYAQFKQRV